MIAVRGYTLTRRLESTGAVQVYAGVREGDGLPVLARLYPVDDEAVAAQVEREFSLIADIASDGVVRAMALERIKQHLVVVFEAFDGLTLDEYASRHKVTPDLFLSIAIQLARTMSEIHDAGVIHKDIKPGNILIDPYQLRTRITGFDISVEADAQVTDPNLGVVTGTLPYVSPEQTGRMRRRVDFRSDLYSLGITLYELATGAPPFTGDEPIEIVHAHLARYPDPPHERREGFPVMLSRIILRLLEKAPEDRYQSAAALLTDMQRCQELLDDRGRIPEFAIGAREVNHQLRASDRMYGRDFESGVLRQAFADVQKHGEMRVVMLSGAPGVGKSALVADLVDQLTERGATFLRGRYDPYTNTAPYAGFREALGTWVNQILTERDEVLAAWRAALMEALSPIAQVAVELVPKLGWVIGPQSPVPEVGSMQSQRRLIEAMRRLVGAMATAERPLVLFMDDLQWADDGSLRLLQGLVASAVPLPVLFIGAYRHRQVGVEHQLAEALERIWEHDPTARAIRLQPLRPADVNRLVADSLQRHPSETVALTDLIARKTDNNPLFVRQFLGYACELGLISHDSESGWVWDLGAIERAGIPDDVAGMMTDKIARLPLRVQRVLKYASVAGMSFDHDTLVALDHDRDKLQTHLDRLVDEGLVARVGEGYRFTHERIREAVHNLIPAIEAARLYRLIGRHRLLACDPDELPERVFDVVDPLNRATSLIQDEQERLQLVELNLLAGRRALESAVSSSAETYLEKGLSLLREQDWERRPDLCFDANLTAAEAARQGGRLERAEELYRDLMHRDLSDRRTARVCAAMVSLYNVLGEPDRAVRVGMMGLRRVGVKVNAKPGRLSFLVEVLRTWFAVWWRGEQTWMELEQATDPLWVAERTIVSELAPATFFTNRNLVGTVVLSALRRMPERGYFAAPALSFAVLGVILGHAFGRYKTGQRMGEIALRLNDRYPDAAGAHRASQLVHGFINPWVRQWREGLEPLERAHQEALAVGDFPSATYSAVQAVFLRFLTGEPLQEVEEHARRAASFAREKGVTAMALNADILATAVECLRGRPEDRDIAEALGLEELQSLNVRTASFDAATLGALVLCVYGRFDEACRLASSAVDDGGLAVPTLMGVEHQVVLALSTGASALAGDRRRRRQARRLLRRVHARLKRWSKAGSINFEPRRALIEAELHRLDGRSMHAMEAYTRARTASENASLVHLRALVLERQATLAAAHGWSLETRTYMNRARSAYRAWGATGKVDQLDERYAELLARPAGESAHVPGSVLGNRPVVAPGVVPHVTALDLPTVMKTARALSEEVEIDKVIERVLVSALANAGANRGLLLLTHDNTLRLEAEHVVDGNYRHYHPAQPVEECAARLAVSVARFVARTKETVVLGDASSQGVFTNDPYVAGTRSRSILCVPILKRTKMIGVLYLENALVARAFTEERQAVLRLVAAQAAISLENARLIDALRQARDDLEARVEARTNELRKAQSLMMEKSWLAGRAAIADGVLHNVGNVLNSVTTAAADLEEVLRRSRLPSLQRTVELIGATDDLATFLETDERGQLVPEFLRLVSEQLSVEQARMRESVAQLNTNVEHVRNVVREQQAFAGARGVTEPVSLTELADQAIRVCGATRPWRDQKIIREFEELPEIPLQKTRVMHILVNLLTNARDALDEGGEASDPRIVMGVKRVGDVAQVSVRDFGVGIAEEHLERIFGHGFTTKRKGHGFGLHLSALDAKNMGGALRAESEGIGRGATFTLELPIEGAEQRMSETG